MKNRITIAAVFTACLALCAAVWPQAETVGGTPAPPQSPAVSAPEATVAEREEKFEATPPSEKEKTESLQPEPPHETTNEPEPAPVEASVASNARPTAESEHASEPTPVPAPAQAVTDLQPGDMVYVEGFGWLEYQGPNHCEYGADIYENGNKIGIMSRPQTLRRINKEITAGEQKSIPVVILCQFIIQNLLSGKDITNLKIGFSIDKLKLLC